MNLRRFLGRAIGSTALLASLTANVASAQWVTSGTNISNTNAGNVGVGTNAPQRKLQLGEDAVPGSEALMRFESRSNIGFNQRAWEIGVPQTGTDLSGKGYSFVIDDMQLNGADPEFVVRWGTGDVGIGTPVPLGRLDVRAGNSSYLRMHRDYGDLHFNGGSDSIFALINEGAATGRTMFVGGGHERFTILNNGNVGVGIFNPSSKLEIAAQDGLKITGYQPFLTLNDTNTGLFARVQSAGGNLHLNTHGNASVVYANCKDFSMGAADRRGAPGRALVDGGDTLVVNFANDWAKTRVDSLLQVKALEIMGGADLAEPFDIAKSDDSAKIETGMVVVIDPANPGQLKLASKAYDRGVAGIISGAGGVNPGVTLRQEGSIANGSQNVALTGRVYCWVDADANGPIKPSDLLTTSHTPGYAMKVTDHGRAGGAIIGKAMSRLDSGKGLVLVLVNLQ